MAWNYSEKTKKLFLDALNNKASTHIGEIKDPDGEGFNGSLVCGDALKFAFKVKKDAANPENDIITEAKYLTFGCTSAIAASEALCIILENNYSPLKALEITKDDIVNFLDGLPTEKIHCSIMGIDALYAAVIDWAKKRSYKIKNLEKLQNKEEKEDNTIVCNCMGHTKKYIKEQIIDLNLKTIDDVVDTIKSGSICGACIVKEGGIKDILNEVYNLAETKSNSDNINNESLSPYQIMKQIEKVVEEEIKPSLKKDGGNIEIVKIENYDLYFKLLGACSSCAGAKNTIKFVIENKLKEKVSNKIRVFQNI